jgi:hypothetical protein
MATSPVAEAPPQMSTVSRLLGALFNPRPTFEDIARRPTWIAPLVVLVLVSLAITAIFGQRVGWRSFMERQFAGNPRTEQMPPEQREQALERAVQFAPVIGYAGAIVILPLAALVVAGVLLGAFNLIASAGIQFKNALGIVTHAWMPGFVGGLLAILVLFLKDPSTVDLEHLVASNPGALLSGDSPKWLITLATSFDLFTIWSILLMAVGFSSANPKKVSVARAFGIIVVLWLAYVLVKVGWVAIMS